MITTPVSPKRETPNAPTDPARPRQLRLSAILIELGADSRAIAGDAASDLSAPSASAHADKRARSNLTLGEIVDRTAHAGFGFLIALLALVAIPFVGLSTPFGLAIGFVGAQMIAGRNRPWLPLRLRRHLVAMSTLDWISRRLAKWTSGVERWIKPRGIALTRGPFWTAVGLGVVLMGLGLALPLPIPGSNWVFILPILLYAIGLLEDDGLMVVVGHLGTAVNLVLGILFYDAVKLGLLKALAWFGAGQ